MLGGELNAYTAKEYTRYYAQTLAENAVSALDIICDMLQNPLLDADDMRRESHVILDEISMYEDSGENVAHETLCAAVGSFALGRPYAVSRLPCPHLSRGLEGVQDLRYTPDKMIVVWR